MNLFSVKKVVVISPHPDDETLGVGGTISKLIKQGVDVNILVVSGHLPPLYDPREFDITKNEMIDAMKLLGVSKEKLTFLQIPATFIHTKPISEFNKKICSFISNINPEIVFIPFLDRHIDHRVIFDASMVCTRPIGRSFPRLVLSYETLSETHWNANYIEPNFNPDFFIDITFDIQMKIHALSKFSSQIKKDSARSLEAVESLAKFRGSQNGCGFAEAFKLIRCIV